MCARLRFIVYAGLIMRVTVKTDETGRRGRDGIARKETRGSRQMRVLCTRRLRRGGLRH